MVDVQISEGVVGIRDSNSEYDKIRCNISITDRVKFMFPCCLPTLSTVVLQSSQ